MNTKQLFVRLEEARDVNPPRSNSRSEIIEEGYPKLGLAQDVDPFGSNEVDEGRSPDLFDSSQRRDSAYYTAATERMGTRRTSGCPREHWSNTSTKERRTIEEMKGMQKRARLDICPILIGNEVHKRKNERY